MDDEATRLLREIRDLLTASAERDIAWREESRRNFARSHRMGKLVVVPLVVLGFCILAWQIYSEVIPALPPGKPPVEQQAPY